MLSPLLQQLITHLSALPGIGPKSAQRIAFQLLRDQKRQLATGLGSSLQKAADRVKHCTLCRFYCEQPICGFCQNNKRQKHQCCVVEGPADVLAIEQTGSYRGQYFVLHGHLSPIDNIGPSALGLDTWLHNLADTAITEVIIATNLTVEGEVTAQYIAHHLPSGIQCTRIAHGVPLGGELEYLDGGTLSHALGSRLPIDNQQQSTTGEQYE